MGANRALVPAVVVLASSALGPVAWAVPTTERVSVTSQEAQVSAGSFQFTETAISHDGRFVLFESESRVLARGDGPGLDVFVRDRLLGVTRTVSVRAPGATGVGGGFRTSISRDGRYIAFESGSSSLVRGDTNDNVDVFVRDMRRGITTRLTPLGRSRPATGAPTIRLFLLMAATWHSSRSPRSGCGVTRTARGTSSCTTAGREQRA